MSAAVSSREQLPNEIAALWLACRCFDVGEEQLPSTSREDIKRAIDEKGCSAKKHDTVQRELIDCLFERLRQPTIARTSRFADEITITLLNIYGKVRQRLRTNLPNAEALWQLIEHVVAPTAYLELVAHRDHGLGTEFQIPYCWYFPEQVGDKIRKPIPRVLDCWLRTAGLRTAHGVAITAKRKSKVTTSDAEYIAWHSQKKNVERWLRGDKTPSLAALLRVGTRA